MIFWLLARISRQSKLRPMRTNSRGGFAIVAFPAAYRSSGVKTFIVSQDGRIFEKDLGPGTAQLAAAMRSYDPEGAWTLVRRNEFLNDQLTP
jgi:hypothetical protein